MDHLPIDIHSNKLLDWLISRRHCPKNWRALVETVRAKIGHAIQDMPENEQIMVILSNAQYINYFHCKQIVDILHDTEKESKNIFGIYLSQRMKDWKEIISLYEKDNVYLAEAANFLQRFVQYEVPALRKQIAKAENTSQESERKEREYAKQTAEVRRNLDRELAKWGLSAKVKDLRAELLAVACATEPTELATVGTELVRIVAYFDAFSTFAGIHLAGMFPVTRFLLPSLGSDSAKRPLGEVTVFEWRHGRRPKGVLVEQTDAHNQSPPTNDEQMEANDDEIDFGDDEIDFGGHESAAADCAIELVCDEAVECGVPPPIVGSGAAAADDGIARREEALPLLEHLEVRTEFLDELDQLASFVDFRLQDELAECGASIYLAGIAQNADDAEATKVGIEQLRGWLAQLRRTIGELSEPNKMQRLRIRTSPQFVDEIVAHFEQKRRLEAKYEQQRHLCAQRQTQCAEEIRTARKLLDGVAEAAKGLQEELEKDLSKRYNGREVYIMGEINAVLYGS